MSRKTNVTNVSIFWKYIFSYNASQQKYLFLKILNASYIYWKIDGRAESKVSQAISNEKQKKKKIICSPENETFKK